MKNKDNKESRLFEEKILYKIIRITNDAHPYVAQLKARVKNFIDKTRDLTILLVEIYDNFMVKKKYLEKMIKVVDPKYEFVHFQSYHINIYIKFQ
jgi:hypothetical protein